MGKVRARDGNGNGINEDVSAEFDAWQVTATRRRSDVDDEEQGRAFIGFDECTVSLAESMSGRMR